MHQNLKLPVAVCVKSDAVNGEIFVRATTGNNLYLLHDVNVENELDGDALGGMTICNAGKTDLTQPVAQQ